MMALVVAVIVVVVTAPDEPVPTVTLEQAKEIGKQEQIQVLTEQGLWGRVTLVSLEKEIVPVLKGKPLLVTGLKSESELVYILTVDTNTSPSERISIPLPPAAVTRHTEDVGGIKVAIFSFNLDEMLKEDTCGVNPCFEVLRTPDLNAYFVGKRLVHVNVWEGK